MTEEEMDEELDNIANGETWAGFQQMPNLAAGKQNSVNKNM